MQMVLSIRKGYQKILQFYSLNVLNLHQVLRPYWVMIQAGDSSEASFSKQTTISVCTNEQLVTKAEIIWALDVVMSKQGRANRECVWGCNTPPLPPPHTHTHTHTHTFFKFVGILTKCVSKISWPNVVSKFGVFYHKKRNADFYQYPVLQILPAMTAFKEVIITFVLRIIIIMNI